MVREVDQRDELISDLQRRIEEVEQICRDAIRQGTV
jgi:hypothetical protein